MTNLLSFLIICIARGLMGPTCDWCIRHFPYLDIADLTAEGSFPLGAGIAAVSITNGYHPLTACLLGF